MVNNENQENAPPRSRLPRDYYSVTDQVNGSPLVGVDLASMFRFNGSAVSDVKTLGVGRKPADSTSSINNSECLQCFPDNVDNGLLANSGSSGCSDFSDAYCVTSDSEPEVRTTTYGNCPKPVKFFVGFDSDSSESDDYFTADECSDFSDEESNEDDLGELDDEDDDITFSDDFHCSSSLQRSLSRSQSWSAPNGLLHKYHRLCIHQSLSESNVINLADGPDTKEKSKPIKCVRFRDNPKVHCIVAWNYAYRVARKGQWEIMAAARDRFQKRIKEFETAYGHIFTKEHHSRQSGDSQ